MYLKCTLLNVQDTLHSTYIEIQNVLEHHHLRKVFRKTIPKLTVPIFWDVQEKTLISM